MTIGYTDLQHYSDIAAAIRSKNGSQATYTPAQMAAAIAAIPTGGGGSIDWGYTSGIQLKPMRAQGSLDLTDLDVSTFTNFASMFNNNFNLTGLDVSTWDTSSATTMAYMFYGCSRLTSLDLSNFDTSNVTNMNYMFENCQALTSVNLSGFDTNNVTDMDDFFGMCQALTAVIWSQEQTVQPIPVDAKTGLGIYPMRTTVYVPDALVTAYQAATNWSTIASGITGISNLPQNYQNLYGIS